MKYRGPLLAISAIAAIVPDPTAPEHAASTHRTPELLERYCIRCHGARRPKGKVRLDNLETLTVAERSELLSRAREAVRLGDMPPKGKRQPKPPEVEQLVQWMTNQLTPEDKAKLDEKLRLPHYGNLVDHDTLFRDGTKDLPYTPARRWLVSPQIFRERIIDVFGLEGRERRNFAVRGFHGVTNPFLLPEHSGVRYYDVGRLDGGHLLTMLTNAKWIAGKQIYAARLRRKDKDQLPPLDKKDRWFPRRVPRAFATIVAKDAAPTTAESIAAIHEQFQRVLRRRPSSDELTRYQKLMAEAVRLGGNITGLQQMLVTVLLESEFLYRLEFGSGKPDRHGRKILAPREAAFAISYALGDRSPDAELLEAATEGRLATAKDFEREVRRLLTDQQYYRGQVDPTLNGKHYRSNETSHPKIIRFFREFFGYPGSLKVFKDSKRALGLYRNPGRGSQATPGWLTYEADKIVTWHVEKDRAVFEQLLTSDEFFVYDNMDHAKGQKLLAEWRSVYERLVDTPWQTEPKRVLEEHLEFLKQQKLMRIRDASRPGELVNYMHFFAESFGKGRQPFTRVPWSHGYTYHHSPFYSLPPTPSIGRYGSWKSTRYMGNRVKPKKFWDYPTKQPFKIAKRKGILTHPAWLIAHSTNFHPDAVRRGRWIREKLLAGRVPDVPITVDAQVPEHPKKTFRQRLEEVTAASECWKCHKHMNPLGLAFEMYDDFGRYRIEEHLEHPDNLIKRGNGKTTFDQYPTLPVVTTGTLSGTGDPKLDGDVPDALEMIDRLARSTRVRQSILRHAFRFFLGRNERLSDSRTLIAADRAYVESGGSFKEVVVALLTSDSFRYRKDDGTRR